MIEGVITSYISNITKVNLKKHQEIVVHTF